MPPEPDKPANMTERQEKWFASIVESMERETGKTLDAWIAIAKTCPETKPNARKVWFKTNYGIGTNRAGVILGAAFPEKAMWSKPDDLRGQLWADPGSRAILEAVEQTVAGLPGLVMAQRKGFTAFSKAFQFASMKPLKGGKAVLGLALAPDADARLQPPKNEGWSERLKSKLVLDDPRQVDASVAKLLQDAGAQS